jgi:hypothetical protein
MKPMPLKTYTAHQELSLLLPWYVNKTLHGAELKDLENHLAVCLVCKREMNQLQKLAQAVSQSGAGDSAEQAAFSRLKKRLHGDQPPILATPLGQSQTKQQESTALRPALAMAAALLVSLSIIMPSSTGDNAKAGNPFRTLSSDKQPDAIKTNEIRVVFAQHASQHDKDIILDQVHGHIVGEKPTAQGVYTVRLGNDIAATHLLDTIDLLRKNSKVIFAEPAYALLSSTQVEE